MASRFQPSGGDWLTAISKILMGGSQFAGQMGDIGEEKAFRQALINRGIKDKWITPEEQDISPEIILNQTPVEWGMQMSGSDSTDPKTGQTIMAPRRIGYGADRDAIPGPAQGFEDFLKSGIAKSAEGFPDVGSRDYEGEYDRTMGNVRDRWSNLSSDQLIRLAAEQAASDRDSSSGSGAEPEELKIAKFSIANYKGKQNETPEGEKMYLWALNTMNKYGYGGGSGKAFQQTLDTSAEQSRIINQGDKFRAYLATKEGKEWRKNNKKLLGGIDIENDDDAIDSIIKNSGLRLP